MLLELISGVDLHVRPIVKVLSKGECPISVDIVHWLGQLLLLQCRSLKYLFLFHDEAVKSVHSVSTILHDHCRDLPTFTWYLKVPGLAEAALPLCFDIGWVLEAITPSRSIRLL